jgi:hypothetical protein
LLAPQSGGVDPRVFGLKADGATSADAALSAAVNYCAQSGGVLFLPAGNILLTGSQTVTLRDCYLRGQAGTGGDANHGTTIELTSTSVVPFFANSNWGMEDISFFWPNQTTGTITSYPPLITDDGTNISQHVTLRNISVINAYDFIAQNTITLPFNDWKISQSLIYAANDAFRLALATDSWKISDTHFAKSVCDSRFNCSAFVTAAAARNTIFHIVGNATTISNGGIGALLVANSATFAWKYGIKIDANGWIENSRLDVAWDGVSTVLQSTAGGCITNTPLTGQLDSFIVQDNNGAITLTGTDPAFNIAAGTCGGNASILHIENFDVHYVRGDFIDATGVTVRLDTVQDMAFGNAGAGGPYYAINLGNSPNSVLTVNNSLFQPATSDTNHYGIKAPQLQRAEIRNSLLAGLYNPVDFTGGSFPIIFVGNNVEGTQSTTAFNFGGANDITYFGNRVDKPPLASVSSCGTSPSIIGARTTLAGGIQVGTGTVTSCTLTLPFPPPGGQGWCVFNSPLGGLNLGSAVLSTTQIKINSGSSMAGAQILFSCAGTQ